MNHYVKEAKEEALKTVERFITKKIDCLKFFKGPSNLRRAHSLLYIVIIDAYLHTFHI